MDANEQAEVYRKAAKVVAGMDEMTSWFATAPLGAASQMSRAYSQEDAIAFAAYRDAARVLNAIADQFEAEAKAKKE